MKFITHGNMHDATLCINIITKDGKPVRDDFSGNNLSSARNIIGPMLDRDRDKSLAWYMEARNCRNISAARGQFFYWDRRRRAKPRSSRILVAVSRRGVKARRI